MKHTQGPWRIASQNYENSFYVIHGNDVEGNREVQVVKMDYGPHPIKGHLDRMQANAKLIAAAPELLEALQLMYELCNVGQPPGNDDLNKAFLAIKKATT